MISADVSTNGIVWVVDRNGNEVRAYSAASLATELWNSQQAPGNTDALGAAVKFAVPMIANGELFVGTSAALVAYGLKAPANAVPAAPVIKSATVLSNTSVNLIWTDATVSPNTATAYLIQDSTDGTNFNTIATSEAGSTSIAVGGLSSSTGYWFRIIGFNPVGSSQPSNVATATTTGAISAISFGGGFGVNASALIQLNGAAQITNNTLVLINNQPSQAASAWYKAQQDITQFTTSFQFSLTGTWPLANGMTFAIQKDLPTVVGQYGASLGYGNGATSGTGGIPNSIGVKFDPYNTLYTGTTGLYTNGAFPGGGNSVELSDYGINLRSYDKMQVDMTYNGLVLSVTLTDLTTKKTETQNYTVNIPAIVGGNTAWIGFTAGSGSNTILPQVFNWTYTTGGGGGGITTSPNTPSGLGAAVASATSITLNWTAKSSNQSGYFLDRATDPLFTQNLVTENLPATPNSFTDTLAGLAPGGTDYYQLRAFNSTGPSGNSNSASAMIPLAPAKPTNQEITDVEATEIDITWVDNAGHAALGYHILRATNLGVFAIIATLPPTSRPAPSAYGYDDTSVQPGNFYEYHIQAYNISGNNDFAGVNATTPTAAHSGLTATPTSNLVSLSWTPANGATGYNVYRSGTKGGPYDLIAPNIGTAGYVDSAVTNGLTYYYVVTGLDADGEGAMSSEVAAKPTPAPIVSIIDDGDAGFSKTGTWGSTIEPGRYYGNDHSFAIGGNGADVATYTFMGLVPGIYRISATWRGDTNRATNTPFIITDGTNTLGTATINQQLQPNSLTDQGFSWSDLGGPYSLTGSTLVVSLSDRNTGNLYIDADAIRIERVGDLPNGPEIQILNGAVNIVSGTSTVNFGSVLVGAPVQITFLVKNLGTTALLLNGFDALPAGFSLAAGLGSANIAPGASTTFILQMDATAPGSYSGTVHLLNNDADEGSFALNLQGSVASTPPPPVIQIIDDGDAGFSKTGTWGSTVEPGRYYGDDHSFAIGGNGADVATYTFTGLVPGIYRVSATWRGDTNRATNTPFIITDGTNTLGTATINQQLQPNSLTDQGFSWGDLGGPYNLTGSTLVVSLSDRNTGNLYIDADAIRIQRVGSIVSGPSLQVFDGTTGLNSGGAADDFGSTTPGAPMQHTFTVHNAGTTPLILGALSTLPAGYSLAANFGTTTIQPGASTTFTVQLSAATTGTFSGAVSFNSNDPAAPSFTLNLTGKVALAPFVQIIDDNNAGYAEVGNWGSTTEVGRYYGDDHSFARGGNGADYATYTFTGLAPGTYRVSATWRGDTNRATNTPFTVSDGSTVVGTTVVNQQLQPASLFDQGFNWGDLGTFTVSSGTLVVTIRDTADPNLYVDADAIRIERVSG